MMKDKYLIALIFIVSFTLFCMPEAMRWLYLGNPTIIGGPTYLHQRIAQDMASGRFNWYDNLSFGGRPYTYPPFFSAGIALFSFAFPIEWAGLFFVSLFGAIGIASMFLILKTLYPKNTSLIASVLLAASPACVFFFSHVSSRAPPVALALLGLYFLIEKKNRYRYQISGALLGAATLLHIEAGLVFAIVYLLLQRDRHMALTLTIAFAVAFSYYGPFLAANGIPQLNAIHQEYRDREFSLQSPTIANYFYELGGIGYITIPLAALAIIGFWKTRNFFLRGWMVFIFAITLIAERFFVYLVFPVVVLAAAGLVWVARSRRKNLAVLLVAAILIYSAALGAMKLWEFSHEYPSKEEYNAFTWIRQNTPNDSVVFADWQWGHWVAGIANRKNFIDGYAEYAPEADKRVEEMENFYRTCDVPQGYNISYIYIEQWFSNDHNMTCLSRFPLLYNESLLLVYKAS